MCKEFFNHSIGPVWLVCFDAVGNLTLSRKVKGSTVDNSEISRFINYVTSINSAFRLDEVGEMISSFCLGLN